MSDKTNDNPKIVFPSQHASDQFAQTRQELRDADHDIFFDPFEEQWVVIDDVASEWENPNRYFVSIADIRASDCYEHIFSQAD